MQVKNKERCQRKGMCSSMFQRQTANATSFLLYPCNTESPAPCSSYWLAVQRSRRESTIFDHSKACCGPKECKHLVQGSFTAKREDLPAVPLSMLMLMLLLSLVNMGSIWQNLGENWVRASTQPI